MLSFLSALWNAMHKGEEVADPAKWKNHQITANAVGGFLLALVAIAKLAFKVEIPFTDQDSLVVGGAIVTLFNVVYTMVTSKKVGMSPRNAADPGQDSDLYRG